MIPFWNYIGVCDEDVANIEIEFSSIHNTYFPCRLIFIGEKDIKFNFMREEHLVFSTETRDAGPTGSKTEGSRYEELNRFFITNILLTSFYLQMSPESEKGLYL